MRMRSVIVAAFGAAALLGIAGALGGRASIEDLVEFNAASYQPSQLQRSRARERGEIAKAAPGDAIQGYVSRPEGNGPFPAIVYLHGCGGMTTRSRNRLTAHLTALGYVTLAVDSFATRGIKQACDRAMPDRERDAWGALVYLSTLPFVDTKRIGLLGYSQGGIAALQVASIHPPDLYEIPDGLSYRAIVAFYPLCRVATDRLTTPTLILIGELDDWTSAEDCKELTTRRASMGAPVDLVIYPGAYHNFDNPANGDGARVYGHLLKYDAQAAESATSARDHFFARQLGN